MIEVREPLPGDVEAVAGNAAEEWVRESYLAGADFSLLFRRPLTRVMLIAGVPVAAGGFVDKGQDDSGIKMAVGWTLVANPPQSHLVALIRAFRREIIQTPFDIVEAHCFETFPASHRWVLCVGFKPVSGNYTAPDGRAFRRFAFRNYHDGR